MRGKSGSAAIVSLGLTALIFAAALAVVFNRQFIVDQLSVWQYDPPGEITQLADATTMTKTGRFYFYASHPVLEDASKFNEDCERREPNSAILGCFRDGKIFIYDVKDERLDGVKEVTAAHEMLHAAYERLGSSEKARVNTLLEQEYQKKLATNETAFKERMEYYDRTQPGEKYNELHSIVATEFTDLPGELEEYFAQYFGDRQAVVRFHDAYNKKFTQLRDSSSRLKQELDDLALEINTLTGQYNDATRVLNNDITRFNEQAERGEFVSELDFRSAREALVGRVEAQQRVRLDIDTKVADYESKRQTYNSLVDESNSLSRSLDSSLAPAPAF